jgi:hypothetical protein
MKHVSLDTQDETIKQFVRALAVDRGGSVLELDGHAVVCVLPVDGKGDDGEDWTEEKNARRCTLISREIAGTLTIEEMKELHALQEAMLRYRRRVAPLPLDDARDLYQELLARAKAEPTCGA